MSDIIIGIDLGTTNSEVAVVEDGKARVIAVDGDPIVPSMVGLGSDGKLLVGKPARNQYVIAPERTIKSVKRRMGEAVKLTLGTQQYSPQEISAMILRKLKEAAERDLGQPVSRAVITVPAYFNDTQRRATREAGELAGLQVVRILNEPTAAALTYQPHPELAECFLVYDLGGGTFDVSIVQAEHGVFEVLASHGDTHLGGDDFDDLLLGKVADDFQAMFGVDLRANPSTRARTLRAVEDAKKALSDHPVVKIEQEFIAEKDGVPLHLSVELERDEFERLIRPLLDRTMQCVQKALDDAKIVPTKLNQVVLVGGSTRTPLVAKLLEERLGQQTHREVHPDLCVALGAAVQAALVAGQQAGAVLVDITPHSLGIKSLELPDDFTQKVNANKFTRIIRRNTPLPASQSEMFSTVGDNQQTVEIEVYQGESDDIRRNHRVGKFTIEGLARVRAGNQIAVQMDLTLDGVLKVSARERATGLLKQITIEQALPRFAVAEHTAAMERIDRLWETDGEIEDVTDGEALSLQDIVDDRLDEETEYDFSDARDDDDGEASAVLPPSRPRVTADAAADDVQQAVLSARTLLEKADRVLARTNADDRAELAELMQSLRDALTAGKLQPIQTATQTLADVLFYLEEA